MGKLVICPAGTFLGLSKETNGRGKIVLVAVEALSVESKSLAAVGVRISADERHGFGAERFCLPGRHHLSKGKPEVRWSQHRSWSDTSGRDQPGSQNSHPHTSLDLL